MATKSDTKRLGEAADALREMLAEAQDALSAGDTQEGERRAKAVSALVRAVRDVAELEAFARAQPPEQDEEAFRAELLGRIRRLVSDETGGPDELADRMAAGARG